MKLIVGLGNPGSQYSGTRHNVGFDVLAVLATRGIGTWRTSRFEAQVAEVLIQNGRVLLLAPQTFMNLSGRSVQAAMAFYKIPAEDLLVICDDMNLPLGKLRLRTSGSAGGQKGLQNIIDQLGTQEFCRLRIGIDRPAAGASATNFVLQKFSKTEREIVETAVDDAVRAVDVWVNEGPAVAMNRFNRDRPSNEDQQPSTSS